MKEYWLKLINKEKIQVKEEEYKDWLNNKSRDYLTIMSVNGNELHIMRDNVLLGIVLEKTREAVCGEEPTCDISSFLKKVDCNGRLKPKYELEKNNCDYNKEQQKKWNMCYLKCLNNSIEDTKSLIVGCKRDGNYKPLNELEKKLEELEEEKERIDFELKEN